MTWPIAASKLGAAPPHEDLDCSVDRPATQVCSAILIDALDADTHAQADRDGGAPPSRDCLGSSRHGLGAGRAAVREQPGGRPLLPRRRPGLGVAGDAADRLDGEVGRAALQRDTPGWNDWWSPLSPVIAIAAQPRSAGRRRLLRALKCRDLCSKGPWIPINCSTRPGFS